MSKVRFDPSLHPLLTLEYLNLVLDRKLTDQEKADVVAFLRTL